MMISLGGGASGPNAGGMTQMSARPVQAVAPPEAEAAGRAAARGEDAGDDVPDPSLKPKPKPSPKADKPVDKSASPQADDGAEGEDRRCAGRTRARRRFRSADSRPAGGARAGGVQLDVGDFCCPEYLATMNQRIRENWNQNQGAAGVTVMKFTIRRDGMLTERRSGSEQPQLSCSTSSRVARCS